MTQTDLRCVQNEEATINNSEAQVPSLAAVKQRFEVKAGGCVDFPSYSAGSFDEIVCLEFGLVMRRQALRMAPFANPHRPSEFVTKLKREDMDVGTPREGRDGFVDFKDAFEAGYRIEAKI